MSTLFDKGVWKYDTVAFGVVTQDDVPQLLMELLADMKRNGEAKTSLSKALWVNTTDLDRYVNGLMKMGKAVGERFINFIEKRAEKQKKKAASAGTETTQRSEEPSQETSPEIVPQPAAENKDTPADQIADEGKKVEARPPKAGEECDDLARELSDLRNLLKAVKKDNALACELLHANDVEIHDLRAQLKAKDEEIRTNNKADDSLIDELAEFEQKVAELTAQNEHLRKTVADLMNAAAEDQRALEMMRQRISQLEAAQPDPDRVAKLEKQIAKLKAENDKNLAVIRDLVVEMLGTEAQP